MPLDPLVSVIVLNWNGKHFLEKCLPSLINSDCKNLDITVLDCASKDGSAEYVKSNFPSIHLREFAKDPGADRANNIGVSECKGDFVVLLNNDTIMQPNTLSSMLTELTHNNNCAVAPTELDWDGHFTRKGYTYGWIAPLYFVVRPFLSKKVLAEAGPFYVGTSCVMTSRSIMNRVPLNDHVIMFADLEWSWRLRLAKVDLKVLDDVYFHHYIAGTLKATAKAAYYSSRVTIATHYICFKWPTLVAFTPILLVYFGLQAVTYSLSRRFDCVKAMWRGTFSFIHDRRTFTEDRKMAQKERAIGDLAIIKTMILSCYYHYSGKSGGVPVLTYIKKLFRGSI